MTRSTTAAWLAMLLVGAATLSAACKAKENAAADAAVATAAPILAEPAAPTPAAVAPTPTAAPVVPAKPEQKLLVVGSKIQSNGRAKDTRA